MNTSRRMLPALAGVFVSWSLLAGGLIGAASADAASPATVTVRVIGVNNQALLPLTQVTTTTAPVVKDGKPQDSCTGTSAAGALEFATKGNWGGAWNSSFGYGVETIEGVSYPFTQPDFWTFWIDNKESSEGICGPKSELSQGDSVLFFVGCFSEKGGCPAAPNVLAIQAPATAEVGKPTAVTVLSYPNAGGEPVPAVGATVVGSGDTSALPTNAQGQTTLIFSGGGNFTIGATGSAGESSAIHGEAFICVHQGNDGTCGTSAPAGGTGAPPKTTIPILSGVSPAQVVAKIAGVKNGHVYRRRGAPRLLKGSVVVPAGGLLRKVQISLRRRYRGRCFNFNGSKVRFVAVKCKQVASFFSVGTKTSFSYLLPGRLPRGSYTYEIEAVDGAGQATKLVSGVSHVVFRVK